LSGFGGTWAKTPVLIKRATDAVHASAIRRRIHSSQRLFSDLFPAEFRGPPGR